MSAELARHDFEFQKTLEAACAKRMLALSRHKERFVMAYCARYGIDTREQLSELCLCHKTRDDGTIVLWIERRM